MHVEVGPLPQVGPAARSPPGLPILPCSSPKRSPFPSESCWRAAASYSPFSSSSSSSSLRSPPLSRAQALTLRSRGGRSQTWLHERP